MSTYSGNSYSSGKPSGISSPEYLRTHDESLCIDCHSNARAIDENPTAQLCSACREKHVRHPIPRWIQLILFIIILSVAFSVMNLPGDLDLYRNYRYGLAAYNDQKYNTAANLLIQCVGDGAALIEAKEMAFLGLAKAQRFNEAGEFFNQYLVDSYSSDEFYDEINDYYDITGSYFTVFNKIDVAMSQQPTGQDPEQFIPVLEKIDVDSSYCQPLLKYYKGLIQYQIGDYKEAIASVESAFVDSRNRYTFMLVDIGNMQRSQHQTEAAEVSYQKALKLNLDSEGALKGLGILALLDGRHAEGLELITQAYEVNKNGYFVVDAYVIALVLNDRSSDADVIYDDWSSQEGFEADPETLDFLAGRISLEDIFFN